MKKEKKEEKFRAETLIRNASANNARYIVNADRKSRILIIVNAAVISVLISLTGFQKPNEILPAIPIAVLLIANIVSLLFALRSVEALHTAENGDKEELKNLLDYKHYGDIAIGDYLQGMKSVLADSEKILKYAIEDLYQQGQLLRKKYKYLKMAFRAFGFGMVAAVITFLLIQFLQ